MTKHSKRTQRMIEYTQIIVGATLVGLAYNMFLLPSKLAAGGISGVSTIVFEVYAYSSALTQLLINIPIFCIGWVILGRVFRGKSLIETFWVHIIIYLTAYISSVVTI